jgi:hypothetical protein
MTLHNINWFTIIQGQCVYCAVRTKYLNIILSQFKSRGGDAMVQAVSRRPFTARFRSQVSTCGMCWTKWCCARFFSEYLGFFSVTFTLQTLRTHLNLHFNLTRRTNGHSVGNFGSQGALDRKILSLSFVLKKEIQVRECGLRLNSISIIL